MWSKREKSNESLAHWLESQALQNAKREERNTCNDNGDLTSNGEWAKCKCVAAGDGDEASACRFSSTLPTTGIWVFFFFFFFENQL